MFKQGDLKINFSKAAKADIDEDVSNNNSVLANSRENTLHLSEDLVNDIGNDGSFLQSKKYIVFSIAVLSQILNQSSASGLYPILPVIQEELNTTVTLANATVAVYAIMIGILSSVWASYADRLGRRRVFISSNTFLVLGNIGSALSVNIGMLLGFRITCAIGAAASNALGAGMINDVFRDHQKGKALSWFNTVSLYSISGSPLICGSIVQYLGWRSVFWSLFISYCVLWIIIVLLLPETNACALQKKRQNMEKNREQAPQTRKNRIINPFASLKLLAFPNMLIVCLYLGFIGFTHRAMGVSFTWVYNSQYQFTTTMVGLFYLSGLPGSTIGAFIGGMISDRVYMTRVERAKESGEQIYPEMRLSLPGMFVVSITLVIPYVTYGWCVEKNLHFSIGIFCLTFVSLGLSLAGCLLTVYAIQSFPNHSSSAQACMQTVKCAFFAAGSLWGTNLENIAGSGIFYTVLGGILLITSPFIIYIQRNYKKWQEKRDAMN
ncbi:major facilitator superfamily domain-containing protein [Phascolomyces articulosus]|uniref:Major facilitator superfamily domain-containing protein n=1 Tax=Phascolomyces articulosus TaxID=60185 RepID=A0AAD5PH42_9FUNG|nr:major facilitator superfamily domain-containing protein [Phascolomyces articulosus]